MVTTGLIVRLEAQAGKEHAVAEFLRSAVPLVEGEPETIAGSPQARRVADTVER